MKKFVKYTVGVGLFLITIGFIYDIMFAGIPPQEPPLNIQNKYDYNSRISSWITNSGLIIMVIGTLIWLGNCLRQLVRKGK